MIARIQPAWAGTLPLVCAVHCLLAPTIALLGIGFASSRELEISLATAAIFASWLLIRRGTRGHRRRWIWMPTGIGALLALLPLLWERAAIPETFLTVPGNLLLAGSLFWSERLLHRQGCHDCGCPTHPPPPQS